MPPKGTMTALPRTMGPYSIKFLYAHNASSARADVETWPAAMPDITMSALAVSARGSDEQRPFNILASIAEKRREAADPRRRA